MDTLLSVMIGVGLAAACGFRVFVPLLVLSLAAQSGHMSLAHGFAWIGSAPATIAFAVATLVEIAGYYIPWVDHLLDTIAAPTAVVAGILVTASALGHTSPFLQWSLALLAGGGTAAVFQGLTTAARGVSTLTTGGLGNPIVSTVEAGGSALLSVLAIAVPPLTVLALVLLLYFGVKKLVFRRPARAA
ncbi:MAG TPA: DUF4126 domain-containing protein [Thermoanaerobaculia bacterium]|jgi:hypothetical protein|nr:DUF4126 domain-containing protein [Thermoanaerobaculia bacterium]